MPRGNKENLLPANRVPEGLTEEATGDWYDTHGTSDLPGEIISDSDEGPVPALETVAVRVSRREIEELKRRARRLGVGYTTYVRMLINRHVFEGPPIG